MLRGEPLPSGHRALMLSAFSIPREDGDCPGGLEWAIAQAWAPWINQSFAQLDCEPNWRRTAITGQFCLRELALG